MLTDDERKSLPDLLCGFGGVGFGLMIFGPEMPAIISLICFGLGLWLCAWANR